MGIKQKTGKLPTLLVCILPDGATDLYTAIKQCVVLRRLDRRASVDS